MAKEDKISKISNLQHHQMNKHEKKYVEWTKGAASSFNDCEEEN